MFVSKSSYRIHSPFVFNFIKYVLKPKKPSPFKHPFISYYIKNKPTITLTKDLGAGSLWNNKKTINTKKYIKKVATSTKYGKILSNISHYYKFNTALELGTSLGIGTYYLASNENCIVTTVEGNKEVYALSSTAFKHIGIENVVCNLDKFNSFLSKYLSNINHVPLVFIDGNHKKQATLQYFYKLVEKINENSILIFDDIYWSKEMNEAWHEILNHKSVKLSIDLYKMGILFFGSQFKEKQHFVIWY